MSAFLDVDIKKHGVVLKTDANGTQWTNVPRLVVAHSPAGYSWGYGGSGPSDLALNILEWLLTDEGFTGERQECYRGSCFQLAWALHQTLKWDVIAHCAKDGEVIPYGTLKSWLDTYRLVIGPFTGMAREDSA